MRRIALAALTALPLAAGAGEPQPPITPSPSAPMVFERGPLLGVELVPTTAELRAHLGGDDDRGALIGRVLDGSAADKAGIRVGDLLVEIDDVAVSDAPSVKRALARSAGAEVRIEVIRDGKRRTLDATLPDGQGAADGLRFGPFGDDTKRFEWTHPDGADHGWGEGRVFEWKLDGDWPEGVHEAVRKALEEAGVQQDEHNERVEAEVAERLERMEQRLETLQGRLDDLLDQLDE